MYEIKEFMVTLDTGLIRSKKPHINQISMRIAFESTSFRKKTHMTLERTEGKVSVAYHTNDRLIPNISDDG